MSPISKRGRQVWLGAAGFLAATVIWQAAVALFHPAPFILPSPAAVVRRAAGYGADWGSHLTATSVESIAGFLLAALIGIALAVLLTLVRPLDHALSPLITAFQIAPKVALAPLFIVWVGIGSESKILMAFLLAFFPVLVGARAGFAATGREYLGLARVLGMSRLQALWKIQLPASLPHIFAGVKVASTLAVIGAVVGEFVSSEKGLGYLVVIANNQLDTALAIASILLLTAFGLALYAVVLLVEWASMPWRRAHEAAAVEGLW
ncbi:MAG: ABC transporter permease [Terriglobia bacterium]